MDQQEARFAHDRLDAYRVAHEALALGEAIAKQLPRGYAGLADQLRRAQLSVLLASPKRRVAAAATGSLGSVARAARLARQLPRSTRSSRSGSHLGPRSNP